MKRVLSALALGVALTSLTACGASSPAGEEPRPATVDATPVDELGRTQVGETSNELIETEVTLRDGRTLTCLVLDGPRSGGVHCLEPQEK